MFDLNKCLTFTFCRCTWYYMYKKDKETTDIRYIDIEKSYTSDRNINGKRNEQRKRIARKSLSSYFYLFIYLFYRFV